MLRLLSAVAVAVAGASFALAQEQPSTVVIAAEELENKIRGGMMGQVIGNLNGLPHEFKYIDEPGQVEHYTPHLPDGAHTDDDTDIEWVYLREIARSGETFLPPQRITELWKRHINRRIWCANRYARDLMDLGFEPPWTGNVGLNPWSEFNISGQFVCESFGLMAPAMPQTAARLGLNYTHVTIDGEPAQATQLFTTMIAMAFIENDLERLLDAGLEAVDPNSEIAEVVTETRKICKAHPDDWTEARMQIKQRWQTHGGDVRDRNGYELNTACTIAALVYGKKDFVETLRLSFNLGWDCDNNAATAATIVGVVKGRRWMNDQGWTIADVYRNTTRDDMPLDETLTGFENTLVECARLAIERQGGQLSESEAADLSRRDKPGGSLEPAPRVYRIRAESPANVERLSKPQDQVTRLRQTFLPGLQKNLTEPGLGRARAAYLAISLDEAERLRREAPKAWEEAVAELSKHPSVVLDLYQSPEPTGTLLRQQAEGAGLQRSAGD